MKVDGTLSEDVTGNRADRRPRARQRAHEVLGWLTHDERERLLVKCWMSHDARWFTAVAQAFGIEAANRLNQIAAREEGKVETRRIVRTLQLPPVASVDDYLVLQEIIIGLLGPELLDYEVVELGGDAFQIRIRRCFAHENVERAGVAEVYECGIFARVSGWLDALDLSYEMTPLLGACARVQGRECAYTFTIRPQRAADIRHPQSG